MAKPSDKRIGEKDLSSDEKHRRFTANWSPGETARDLEV